MLSLQCYRVLLTNDIANAIEMASYPYPTGVAAVLVITIAAKMTESVLLWRRASRLLLHARAE